MAEKRKKPWRYSHAVFEHNKGLERGGTGYVVAYASGGRWAVQSRRTGARIITLDSKRAAERWIREKEQNNEQ